MDGQDASRAARALYQRHVLDTGYDPPRDYAELLLFAELSGAAVHWQADAPACFDGIQIGGSVFVSAAPRLSDRERMTVLAHEWCHYLRREQACGTKSYDRVARFYSSQEEAGLDDAEVRDWEERVANAFARLF